MYTKTQPNLTSPHLTLQSGVQTAFKATAAPLQLHKGGEGTTAAAASSSSSSSWWFSPVLPLHNYDPISCISCPAAHTLDDIEVGGCVCLFVCLFVGGVIFLLFIYKTKIDVLVSDFSVFINVCVFIYFSWYIYMCVCMCVLF